MKHLVPYITPFLMLGALTLGLFPQSAGDPVMMIPFFIMSSALIFSGGLFKIPTQDPTLLVLIILWFLWLVSAIHSAVPFPSKVTWIIFSALPTAYILARTTHKTPLSCLSLICAPFAIYTIWQTTQGIHRPNAPFDDANSLGLFYAFGILSAIPVLQTHPHRYVRIFFRLIIITLIGALALTQSRSALLCIISGGVFYFLINTKITTYLNKKTLIKIALAITPVIALLFATGFIQRLGIFPTGRIAIWQGAANMATEHPFMGFGLGTFHLYYPPYRKEGDDSLGWMVHMDPLQTAIESGWITTALLYILFITPLAYLYKNRHTITQNQIGAGAILIAFFIGMHLNYPMHIVPFLIILGMGLAIISPHFSAKPIPIITSCSITIALLSAIWTMTQTSTTLMLAEETQKSYLLQDQSRFDAAISACINDGDKDFPDCRLMAARFLTLATATAHARNHEEIESLLTIAEQASPTSPEPNYLRALNLLKENSARMDDALSLLKTSLSLNPAYWPSRRLAIEILIKKGNNGAARAILNEGLIYPYATQVRDDISRIRKTLDGHQ